ncbi:MAG: ABC transporter ATP-binding protein [Candidatus Chloroheliales bacterium]|nr:MAG: ABC transporter ATP-binding protein [Chloroflexota bacterium]
MDEQPRDPQAEQQKQKQNEQQAQPQQPNLLTVITSIGKEPKQEQSEEEQKRKALKPLTREAVFGTYRRLLGYLRPFRGRFAIGAASLIISTLLGLVLPWVVQHLVDSVFTQRDRDMLNLITFSMIGVFVLQSIFNYIQTYNLSYIGEAIVTNIRIDIYKHLQSLDLSFYNNYRIGELISRTSNDVVKMQGAVSNDILGLVQQLIILVGAVSILLLTDWRLTLVILLVLPPVIGIGYFFGGRLRRLSEQVQAALGKSTTVLEETLTGIRTVKAFTNEGYEVGRFSAAVGDSFQLALRRTRVQAIFVPLITLAGFGAIVGVLWFGGQEVLNGNLSSGQLISFILYMAAVVGPISTLAGLYSQLQEAVGAANRIFELLDAPSDIRDAPNAPALPPVQGALAFEHVDFSYADNEEGKRNPTVLQNLSWQAAPGQVIALVGPSGAGKTTVANLIPRFYDVSKGHITVDGYDIRGVQVASLRAQIAIVPQEAALFGGTVRENIAYGKLTASDAEIEAAARAANAHEFITAFPDGYASVVGERGVKLSGGQRQRIAIARAILRDPRLLILDEATSSLDNESEHLVQEALDRLMRGRTTLVIAHRLTTVQNADRILVLDKGQLVEEGSHSELMQREGLYFRLYTRNFAADSPTEAAPLSLSDAALAPLL